MVCIWVYVCSYACVCVCVRVVCVLRVCVYVCGVCVCISFQNLTQNPVLSEIIH